MKSLRVIVGNMDSQSISTNMCDYCEKYNNEHKGWPKLHPHLMTDGDMKSLEEEQEREYEMFDRW